MPEQKSDPNLSPLEEITLRKALRSTHAEDAVGDILISIETSSTNDDAIKLAREGAPENTLVLTENQTAGRGRRGNEWNSTPSRDLLFSMILQAPATLAPEQLGRIPHLIAVAICRGIEEIYPVIEAKLKWPNDVYIQGKKVAGILVENTSNSGLSHCIAGIGINVNSQSKDRPPELQQTATSLREETGETLDRHQVISAFLSKFHQLYPALLEDFSEILAVIEERSLLLGAKISAQLGKTEITGKVIDFGINGEMIVEVENKGKAEQQVLNSADQVRLL